MSFKEFYNLKLNIMKKPELEEVKEYFKNAKEVKIKYSSDVYNVSEPNTRGYFEFKDGYWLDLQGFSIRVWSEEEGYAKILTYKEPKEESFVITSEQLRTISVCADELTKQQLKSLFPTAFEPEKKELVVGRWYKKDNLVCLIKCIDEKGMYFQRFHCFGFNTPTGYDDFCFDINNGEYHGFSEVDFSEVKVLIEERINSIGFKKGDWITWKNEGKGQITGNFYWYEKCLAVPCDEKTTNRNNHNFPLFHEGIFAEIIQPKKMTKAEIETELGYNIEIVS